ncbi:MAG: hypothetical protein DRI86_15735 [Bacteroidetes bacterium]|nr:MAG: hypothetical protein DRI86_15735 [Bacteroidota bacterium]
MNRTKLYKTYNIIIRSVIIITSLFFIVHQLFVKQDFSVAFSDIEKNISSNNSVILILISILLMPINWAIEAIKWKYLLKVKENISFWLSLKAILVGTSISAVSPNRTGDYFARVFVLKKTSFWEGVLVTLVGSFAQTLTTLLFGSIAFFSLFSHKLVEYEYITEFQLNLVKILFLIGIIFSIIVYYRISLLSRFIPSKWRKTRQYINILQRFSFKELSTALAFSTFRYTIYSLQFYILLLASGIDNLSLYVGLGLTSSIFLLNTIRPSIALLEIGIRTSIAIFVFSLYFGFDSNMDNGVFAASTLIWLINIIFPALIGLLFIKDLKFFNTQNK